MVCDIIRRMNRKNIQKTQPAKKKFVIHKYSVVEFDEEEENERLFECIPDLWFVNELKDSCRFPPRTGRTFQQRAISCEKPRDDWSIHSCKVVAEGFLTYHAGFKLVKEKCAQHYNTSSADEHIQANEFRRKHPTSICGNIEYLFTKVTPTAAESTIANEVAGSNTKRLTFDNEANSQTFHKSPVVNESSVGKNSKLVHEKANTPSDENDGIGLSSKKRIIKRPMLIVDSSPSSNSDGSRSKDSQISHRHSSVSRLGSRKSKDSRSRSRSAGRSKSASCSRSTSWSKSTLPSKLARRSKSKSRSKPARRSRSTSRSKSESRSDSVRCSRSTSRSKSTRPSKLARRSTSTSRSKSACRSRSSRRSRTGRHSRTDRRSRSTSQSKSTRRSKSVRRSKAARNDQQSRHSYDSVHSCGSDFRSSNHASSRSRSRSRQSSVRSILRPNLSHHSQLSRLNASCKLAGTAQTQSGRTSKSNERKGNQKNGMQSSLNVNTVADQHHGKASHNNRNPSTFKIGSASTSHQMDLRKSLSISSSNTSVTKLTESVNELAKAVTRYNEQMVKNDRRLNRLEVTVNKIFITVGDMNGNNRMDDDLDADFNFPDLPIRSKSELRIVHHKLKDKEFRIIWLRQERNFCCPTKTSTDCVTITKYLKRFVSLEVRCQLTLKERGERTLYKDYYRVYSFLIDVMIEGYRICRKNITQDEAHTALRVVWGRSKQLNDKK